MDRFFLYIYFVIDIYLFSDQSLMGIRCMYFTKYQINFFNDLLLLTPLMAIYYCIIIDFDFILTFN